MHKDNIKIGVYTICKNESKFVEKFVRSMYCNGKGADRIYILDTGSTDDTVKLFKDTVKKLNISENWIKIKTKSYKQFRFDVARNDNLAMTTPDSDWLDILISIDLDEVASEELWDDLREKVMEHPDFSRINYLYAWNHDEDNNPKRVFWYNKAHCVKGCKWVYPVHEFLEDPNTGCYYLDSNKIYVHHYPDDEKSRSSYLPLLEIRAKESPDDIYGLFYLMREYTFYNEQLKALSIAHIIDAKIRSNDIDVCDDMDCKGNVLMNIANIYSNLHMDDNAEFYYSTAIKEAPHIREVYIRYASFCAYRGKPEKALDILNEADIHAPTKYPTWYEMDYNWTWRPLQIKAVAYCWQGKYKKAKKLFESTIEKYIKTPTDKNEAKWEGFYDDYKWVCDYLENNQA